MILLLDFKQDDQCNYLAVDHCLLRVLEPSVINLFLREQLQIYSSVRKVERFKNFDELDAYTGGRQIQVVLLSYLQMLEPANRMPV